MNIAAELAAGSKAHNTAANPLTGGIQVTVCYNRDHIKAVEIKNSRPFAVTRLFREKPVDRVLAMMPSLFYICGMGQLIAALRAVESAAGITETSAIKQARDTLLFAESLREQVFSWVTNWAPQHKSRMSHVVDWFNQCRKQLDWSLTLASATSGEARCRPALEQLARQLEDVVKPLLPANREGASLATMGVSAGVCQLLKACGEYPLGLAAKTLNLNESQQLMATLAALNAAEAEQFCHQPTISGVPAETGSWARQNIEARGFIIESRLRSLYREITTAPMRLRSTIRQQQFSQTEGTGVRGCSVVETARGTLLHKVALDNRNHVAKYQIIAPTEWNFHPQGSLKTMLEGLYLPWEQVTPVAETLIKLLDPCVSWQLELVHA